MARRGERSLRRPNGSGPRISLELTERLKRLEILVSCFLDGVIPSPIMVPPPTEPEKPRVVPLLWGFFIYGPPKRPRPIVPPFDLARAAEVRREECPPSSGNIICRDVDNFRSDARDAE